MRIAWRTMLLVGGAALAGFMTLGGCAQIDGSRFAQLSDALEATQTRTVDTHTRVRRLQEVVYRNKVSLAPRLDSESLARPEWLDTNAQFRHREAAIEAMREFTADLRNLAGMSSTQSARLRMQQLADTGDGMRQTGRDLIAAASILKPIQPIFSGLVSGLAPQVSLVSAAVAVPMLEYARRSDLRKVMQTGQLAFKARIDSLVPTSGVLAEYVMALKSEYLPDASALRDQLTGGDRMRFDQSVIDLLTEFDAVAAQAASLAGTLKLVERAYADTLQGLR